MGSLINRSECRKFALAVAKKRSDRFTRISKSYLDKLDAAVKTAIEKTVQNHPSIGKTITEFNQLIKG